LNKVFANTPTNNNKIFYTFFMVYFVQMLLDFAKIRS
jgi:hypothetical protein